MPDFKQLVHSNLATGLGLLEADAPRRCLVLSIRAPRCGRRCPSQGRCVAAVSRWNCPGTGMVWCRRLGWGSSGSWRTWPGCRRSSRRSGK